MERDRRELVRWLLSFVVSLDGILQSCIGRRIIHLLSVGLREYPVFALPVVTDTQPVRKLRGLQGLEPKREEVRDRNHPA